MAQQIGEDTKITLDLKTIGLAITGLGALISMWFALQADIAEVELRLLTRTRDLAHGV